MVRSLARRILSKVRRINRAWINRLDPDWPPAAPQAAPAPAPAPEPEPPPRAGPRATGPIDIMPLATPNPDAIKFNCSVSVTDTPTTWVAGQRATDPIGSRLLAIPEVASAFAVGDFVTVTRTSGADWNELEGKVVHAIREGLTA